MAVPHVGTESKQCTPMYCFKSDEIGAKLHCLPSICALLGPAVPSPISRVDASKRANTR